jgi:serine/threonine protein phosphatase PrpC
MPTPEQHQPEFELEKDAKPQSPPEAVEEKEKKKPEGLKLGQRLIALREMSKSGDKAEADEGRDGLEKLKAGLAGERVYAFIKGEPQYLNVIIKEEADGGFSAQLVKFNADGSQETVKTYQGDEIDKIKYKERRLVAEDERPKDSDKVIFRNNKGRREEVDILAAGDEYFLKNKKGNVIPKGMRGVPAEKLMKYQDADGNVDLSMAMPSRSEAVNKYNAKQGLPSVPVAKEPAAQAEEELDVAEVAPEADNQQSTEGDQGDEFVNPDDVGADGQGDNWQEEDKAGVESAMDEVNAIFGEDAKEETTAAAVPQPVQPETPPEPSVVGVPPESPAAEAQQAIEPEVPLQPAAVETPSEPPVAEVTPEPSVAEAPPVVEQPPDQQDTSKAESKREFTKEEEDIIAEYRSSHPERSEEEKIEIKLVMIDVDSDKGNAIAPGRYGKAVEKAWVEKNDRFDRRAIYEVKSLYELSRLLRGIDKMKENLPDVEDNVDIRDLRVAISEIEHLARQAGKNPEDKNFASSLEEKIQRVGQLVGPKMEQTVRGLADIVVAREKEKVRPLTEAEKLDILEKAAKEKAELEEALQKQKEASERAEKVLREQQERERLREEEDKAWQERAKQGKPESEENDAEKQLRVELVAAPDTFDGVIKVLQGYKEISGSTRTFKTKDIIDRINGKFRDWIELAVKDENQDSKTYIDHCEQFNDETRTAGLRDKLNKAFKSELAAIGGTAFERKAKKEKPGEPERPRAEAKESKEKEKSLDVKVQKATFASEKHPNENQDKMFEDGETMKKRGIAAVFDGIGGEEGGEIAAQAARDFVFAKMAELPNDLPPAEAKKRISQILKDAHQRIREEQSRLVKAGKPELAQMATTASVVKVLEQPDGKRVAVIGNVGDSRVYRLRNGKLEQVTLDDNIMHNGETMKKLMGGKLTGPEKWELQEKFGNADSWDQLTDEEQEVFDRRNIVTQSLGSQHDITPRMYQIDLQPGDQLVLMSDGPGDNLTTDEMQADLNESVAQGRDAAQSLAELGRKRSHKGGHMRAKQDDMTVQVIDPHPEVVSPNTPPETETKKSASGEKKERKSKRKPDILDLFDYLTVPPYVVDSIGSPSVYNSDLINRIVIGKAGEGMGPGDREKFAPILEYLDEQFTNIQIGGGTVEQQRAKKDAILKKMIDRARRDRAQKGTKAKVSLSKPEDKSASPQEEVVNQAL